MILIMKITSNYEVMKIMSDHGQDDEMQMHCLTSQMHFHSKGSRKTEPREAKPPVNTQKTTVGCFVSESG